jgi:hypothetical protein
VHLPPLQLRVLEQGTKKQGAEVGSVTDLGGIEVEKSLIGGFLLGLGVAMAIASPLGRPPMHREEG